MKKLILIMLCALLAGCVVSKQRYQDQFLEARELSSKVEGLESRLERKEQEGVQLTEKIAVLEEELETVGGEKDVCDKSLAETRQQLEKCRDLSAGLEGELDVGKKSLRSAEAEHGKLLGRIEEMKANHTQKLADIESELKRRDIKMEEFREKIHISETDRAVLMEQKEKLKLEKQERIDELSKTYDELLTAMEGEIEKGQVQISKLKGQLSVNLLNEILFDSGEATVKEQGQEVLLQVAEALKNVTDKAIVIEGHTDNVPIIGGLAERFSSNWELSTARSVSVVRYLVDAAGLDPTKMVASGYGEHRPVSENDTEEGRAKNRRIEIKLVPLNYIGLQNSEEAEAGQE